MTLLIFEIWIMIFLGQLWELNGKTLTNKGNLWKSNHQWEFRNVSPYENIELVFIVNLSTSKPSKNIIKVLGILQNGEVTEQTWDPNILESGQYWVKIPSTINADFFMLTNFKLSWKDKLIAAISDLRLKIKGKYVNYVWTRKTYFSLSSTNLL
jgi:hypothetical protein